MTGNGEQGTGNRKNLFAFLIFIFFAYLFLLPIFAVGDEGKPFSVPALDKYGGYKKVKTKATGFFRVEKIKNRWWFVTPEGHPFFSNGVNHVNAEGFYAPALGFSPYKKNIMEKYGNEQKWFEVARDRLLSWGFNTLGTWGNTAEKFQMPYVVIAECAGADWQKGTFPDVFDGNWKTDVILRMDNAASPRKNDPYLLGYFLDNELRWTADWRGVENMMDMYMLLPENSAGKKAVAAFLKKRYKTAADLNKAWNVNLSSLDELIKIKQLKPSAYSKAAWKDTKDFLRIVAQKYFTTCSGSIKKSDPNHLLLGARFHSGGAPREVLEEAGKTMDVISVNFYPMGDMIDGLVTSVLDTVSIENNLIHYYEITKKPVLISETSFKAMDSGLPNSKGASLPLISQAQRAKYFARYYKFYAKTSYIIGYHWYCYMDEPATGRFDGENSNFGIVNEKDEPWAVLTDKMKELNLSVYGMYFK